MPPCSSCCKYESPVKFDATSSAKTCTPVSVLPLLSRSMGVPAGLIGRLMLYFAGKGNMAVSNVPRIWVLSLAKLASCLIAFAASINATTGSGKVSGEA